MTPSLPQPAANDNRDEYMACRLDLQAELRAITDGHAPRLLIDGVLYERHQDGSASYHSLCGTMPIRRSTYRKAGERNGPTVVPLDLTSAPVCRIRSKGLRPAR